MESKSVKTQSETRLNQIENKLRHLEGHQNRPGDADDVYSYEDYNPNYPQDY